MADAFQDDAVQDNAFQESSVPPVVAGMLSLLAFWLGGGGVDSGIPPAPGGVDPQDYLRRRRR